MSIAAVIEIQHNRSKAAGPDQQIVCVGGRQGALLRRLGRHTRVGLCSRHILRDLAGHYDSRAVLHALCKLLVVGSLCCTWLTQVRAQDGQSQTGLHHHPPQDQLLHEKFYSSWRMPDHPFISCCNDADCYPTEIRYVDGTIYAKRREDGKYIPIPPEKVERNRDNPDGRNHLCAPPPDDPHPNDTVFCFALGGAT
jgi:hypothetical protein